MMSTVLTRAAGIAVAAQVAVVLWAGVLASATA